jgi:hypothetical protein
VITHHCSVCGTYVEEFCADHPKAQVVSVNTPELTATEAERLREYIGQQGPCSSDEHQSERESRHPLYLHCPVCGELSGFVLGPTQALCTNTTGGCKVIMFNPSLPDGGMSNPHFIDLDAPADG